MTHSHSGDDSNREDFAGSDDAKLNEAAELLGRAVGGETTGSYKHGSSNTPFVPNPKPLFTPPASPPPNSREAASIRWRCGTTCPVHALAAALVSSPVQCAPRP